MVSACLHACLFAHTAQWWLEMCHSNSNPTVIGIPVASVINYYSKKNFFVITGTNYQTNDCLSMKYATFILCLFLSELFTGFLCWCGQLGAHGGSLLQSISEKWELNCNQSRIKAPNCSIKLFQWNINFYITAEKWVSDGVKCFNFTGVCC